MAIQGPIPVSMGAVFAHGAFAVSVEPVRDFDKSTKDHAVQAVDKVTGERLWAVEVYDPDPQARQNQRSVVVKIPAPVQPVLPEAAPGMPFRPVEFEGMTVTPYVNSNNNRLAYSLRARQMRAPGGKPVSKPSAA
jgi:hypothetical protein